MAVTAGEGGNDLTGLTALTDRDRGQLDGTGPALGTVGQGGHLVGGKVETVGAQESRRLRQGEAQVGGA